jgi:hypothetical protein
MVNQGYDNWKERDSKPQTLITPLPTVYVLGPLVVLFSIKKELTCRRILAATVLRHSVQP